MKFRTQPQLFVGLIILLGIVCSIQGIKMGRLRTELKLAQSTPTTSYSILMATPTPKPSLGDDPEDEYAGPILNKEIGTVEGPSGKETYYNLPMEYVVQVMRDLGYSLEEYPYWVREDGCKMFGPYIMCAADLVIRPRGTILHSSLGDCIVCDTGEFIYSNPTQIDIAVNW